MTQLVLNIENPMVLPRLRDVLASFDGISIADDGERDAILSAFKQVKRLQNGTLKTRSVEELLNEY